MNGQRSPATPESMSEVDPYSILGVPPSAPQATLRTAFHKRVKLVHPDLRGSSGAAETRRLNEAWARVGSEARRAHWDAAHPRITRLESDAEVRAEEPSGRTWARPAAPDRRARPTRAQATKPAPTQPSAGPSRPRAATSSAPRAWPALSLVAALVSGPLGLILGVLRLAVGLLSAFVGLVLVLGSIALAVGLWQILMDPWGRLVLIPFGAVALVGYLRWSRRPKGPPVEWQNAGRT